MMPQRKLTSLITFQAMNTQKKLINHPQTCVEDAIQGVLLSDAGLKRIDGLNILVRADVDQLKSRSVSIISGGGSGHEPAHAGFIGEGMLTAAVLGNVFASPSVASILAAIRTVAGPKGVLLIVKNYTGDRLNFGMASEIAKQEGIQVMMVIVADDCALPLGKGITGGRGLAGTIFVHKVAGAHAAKGASLQEVHASATAAAARIGTMGIALSTCTVPGTPASTRLSQAGLIEVGMGIHGEPGREQMILPETGAADRVAQLLVAGILDTLLNVSEAAAPPRLSYSAQQRVAVMVNNLGALPVIEMQIVTKGVMQELAARGLVPVRAYVGAFMTSLEMCGISLSLFIIDNEDDIASLDLATTAPAWVKSSVLDSETRDLQKNRTIAYTATERADAAPAGLRADLSVLDTIEQVCHRIVAMEPELTAYDAICGDGDCGMVMKKGAEFVLQDLQALRSGVGADTTLDTTALFNRLAAALSASMGGTSGVLLELCFRAVATSFSTAAANSTSGGQAAAPAAGPADWVRALRSGVDAIQYYGGASAGMRTMLDAFIPAVIALENGGSVEAAAGAAVEGTEATKSMQSQAGRSNYVSQETMQGTPDPGASAVAAAFTVIAASLK